MADLMEYIRWRGDILFSQVPPNPVDSLIFSALSYIQFHDVVEDTPDDQISFWEASEKLLSMPDAKERVRIGKDLELLRSAASSKRFGSTYLSFYRNIFIPEEDTQFAAVAFILDNDSVFLAFRGTDESLIGWKEDFNMSFKESVPAQRLAQRYTEKFAGVRSLSLYLGGHSKGGNLAVYAAAKSSKYIQDRIIDVYNFDGPGFTTQMLNYPGYQRIIPKVRTYVPQSSVFGMLLEREESYTIIRSKQIGLLQHDPYTWEVLGDGFEQEQKLTADSRFLNRMFKTWLEGMTNDERNVFVDTLFDLLIIEDTNTLRDIIRPQNLRSYFRNLKADENMRKVIAAELTNLIQSARSAQSVGRQQVDTGKE